MRNPDHFRKAQEHLDAAWVALKEADRLCRAEAFYDRPCPDEWGQPSAEGWLTVRGGAETFHTECPPGPSLRVWRFTGWECTATFNRWQIWGNADISMRLEFSPVRPPVGDGWEQVGKAKHHSTLWRREVQADD